jgi:histidinol-phosphate/aromatic aminotransferase/cobyric acid decarboxylase-like protein
MLDHLRVSIGTEDEMGRFMSAFEDIMRDVAASNGGA